MEQTERLQSAAKLSAALMDVAELLPSDPVHAESRLGEILTAVPGQQQALLLSVCERRMRGDKAGARAALEAMAAASPGLASVHYELGLILAASGETRRAIGAFSRVVALEPNHPAAWRALGNQLARAGDRAAAGMAYARQMAIALKELDLLEQASDRGDGELGPAENMLRELLKVHRTDASLMHMLARIGMRLQRHEDAEQLLGRVLELTPTYDTARYDYAVCLQEQRKWELLDAQTDILLKRDPQDPSFLVLKAEALTMLGEYDQAIGRYEALLADYPEDAYLWAGYGHALRTLGRYDDAVTAYRNSVKLEPSLGRAWWSLANLKTFRFPQADIETMKALLGNDDLAEKDRLPMHFALGKALEDRREHAESFEHYSYGNKIQRAAYTRSNDLLTRYVRTCRGLFTPEFFGARTGAGAPLPDPIFIVGLTRSGSTLIEQILSSHSSIEGTTELPDLTHIVIRLNGKTGNYPKLLERLEPAELRALGEEYLERTRIHRKLGRPFFIDKLPNNFEHVGLIHLILPNAKIIDTRRHPMSCCFSNFKHHFQSGLGHTCDLAEMGRYYRDYVELMAHFDHVLPGRVHRVFYEDMIRNPENEIRRLLGYCGVPFEPACLRFHETARSVRTASSEQVRRPIYADAVEQWRNYERWLGPLKAALGSVLDHYPAVPAF
jgi:tetratricopeptide (TPR) repeat protein